MDFNKIILKGRVGKDPEVKNLKFGDIVELSVATSDSWKDKESGKLFRNEDYLDLYLYKKYFVNNNQSSNQLYNAGRQPTCLSNFCDKVLNGCYDPDDLAKSLGMEVYTDELRDINHPNFHRAKSLYLSQNKVS